MSTFLEKAAANRLGKEVLKKWLSKSPSSQAFHNKLTDSLMNNMPRHAKATGPDRVKFIARGGDEATGKVSMPKPSIKKQSAPPAAKEQRLQVQAPKPTQFKVEPVKAKAQAANDNKYLKRVGIGAGVATVGVGAGAFTYNKFKKKKAA